MQIRLATLALSVLMCLSAYSQKKPKSQDYFFFTIGHGHLLESEISQLEQNGWGSSFSLEFMRENMFTDNLGIALGLGYRWESFSNNLHFSYDRSGNNQFAVLPDTAFTSNRLNVQYLHVPLEIRLRGNPNDKGHFWRLYFGANLGLRTNSYSDLRRSGNYKVQYYRFDNLARLRADAFARIGYRFVNLYLQYALTPLVESGKAEYDAGNGTIIRSNLSSLRPLHIGLSFSF